MIRSGSKSGDLKTWDGTLGNYVASRLFGQAERFLCDGTRRSLRVCVTYV